MNLKKFTVRVCYRTHIDVEVYAEEHTFIARRNKLIIGTNLGGLGTLIASMASLISFKQYSYIDGADKKKYIGVFTMANIAFLIVMCAMAAII